MIASVNIRTIVRVILGSLYLSTPTLAQESSDARAVIDALFDGMRAGDSSAVREVFVPEAVMQSVALTEQGTLLQEGSVDRFVSAIGTPHDEVWDERIYDVELHVDAEMAAGWVPYKFYLGETFSHCGVNQFTLIKQEAEWRILSILDTRRKQDCP